MGLILKVDDDYDDYDDDDDTFIYRWDTFHPSQLLFYSTVHAIVTFSCFAPSGATR